MDLKIYLNKKRFKGLAKFSSEKVFGTGNLIPSDIVIDTGCTTTAIALKGKHFSDEELHNFKVRDAISYKKRGYPVPMLSIGVNDREKNINVRELSVDELMARKDVGFAHILHNFSVDGFDLGDVKVKIMYDWVGDSLLGMNTLQDYHCEISKDVEDNTYFAMEKFKRSGIERCKYILHGLLYDKRMTLSEAYTCLSEEYSDECLYKSMYELLNDHHVEDDK